MKLNLIPIKMEGGSYRWDDKRGYVSYDDKGEEIVLDEGDEVDELV